MASSAVTSPGPVSYADRARKAQKIRSSTTTSRQTPVSTHPSHKSQPSLLVPEELPLPKLSESSTSPTTDSSKTPAVNVWSHRMAAARAAAPTGTTNYPETMTTTTSVPSGTRATSQASVDEDDPIVPPANPQRVQKPSSLIDDEAWPEVGTLANQLLGERTKAKWVHIPSAELQAAVDAVNKERRRPHSQSKSQSGSRKPSFKAGGQGSTSASAAQSRIPTAPQSRSESLQSSPFSSKGRGLPQDKEISEFHPYPSRPCTPPPDTKPTQTSITVQDQSSHIATAVSIPSSISRPRSPSLIVQPHLAPPAQPIHMYNPNSFTVPYAASHGSSAAPSVVHPTTPPPGSYPFVYPYTTQNAWYLNPAVMPHWNPNAGLSTAFGQHTQAYHNLHVYPTRQPAEHHQELTSFRPDDAVHRNSTLAPLPSPSVVWPVTTAAVIPRIRAGDARSLPIFGSLSTARSPSPALSIIPRLQDEDEPKAFRHFTIGVAPGEKVSTRSRLRPPSQASASSHHSAKRSRTLIGNERVGLSEVFTDEMDNRVIDLTGGQVVNERRWAFGTVGTSEEESAEEATELAGNLPPSHPVEDRGYTNNELLGNNASLRSSSTDLQKRLEQLILKDSEEDGRDPFEVQDYGYGFGSRESPGGSPRAGSQKDFPQENDGVHVSRIRERQHSQYRDDSHSAESRPRRRGAFHNSGLHNVNYGQGTGQDGRGHTRRGRGNYHTNGRGGYSHRRSASGQHFQAQPSPRSLPFVVDSGFETNVANGLYAGRPTVGIGMNALGGTSNVMYYDQTPGYYDGTPHLPIPASQVAPFPAPMTPLPFPLDTTRWYLLGQLEYYLSAQNMVQDYFLRQRLDSRGWVPISLIASFNRVRQLTEDENFVREVLMLSNEVEVQGSWVRMKDWRAFVLPGAQSSTVEDDEGIKTQYDAECKVGLHPNHEQNGEDHKGIQDDKTQEEPAGGGANGDIYEDDDEDEDEDDVVFVLTRDDHTPYAGL
ncbi:hypothetical protein H0H93_008116 [Arthromyces matolae]|nr:hypothetical protein H0H93_008116 [Arthromyces matolae]